VVECVLECCVMGECVCWTWHVLWVSVFVGHGVFYGCVFYMRVHFVVECVLDMLCFMGDLVLSTSVFYE